MGSTYETWEHFKVTKMFTLFPLRIYQGSSHRLWWSWLGTVYVFKQKRHGSPYYGFFSFIKWVNWVFYGYYWKNSRMSNEKEYNEYLEFLIKNYVEDDAK